MKFLLHWLGRTKPEVVEGVDLQDAFNKAGIKDGALLALDYWEPLRVEEISEFGFFPHTNQDYQIDSYFVIVHRGDNHKIGTFRKTVAENAIRRLSRIAGLVKVDSLGDVEFSRK